LRSIAGVGPTILLAAVLLFASAADARADWLISPFAGGVFAGDTTFVDLEQTASSAHFTFGVSAGWLSDQILGFEGDLAFTPNFWERGDAATNVIVGSNLYTLSGNVLVAVPLSVTQYSLRPYLTGGFGMIHAAYEDLIREFPLDTELPAMTVGGGAIGFVTERTGVRFDLRHVRSLDREEDALTGDRRTKLRFWRATVGVVLRY
jgi:hypothetical protein